jgi:hypothetical protein
MFALLLDFNDTGMLFTLFQSLRSNSHPFVVVDEQPIKIKESNDIRHTLDTPNALLTGKK